MKAVIRLNVNGVDHELFVPLHKTLLEVIREELGLTGTKHGCELGECGACTVLVDGLPLLSCVTMPVDVQGKKILTVEGIGSMNDPHPLQSSFTELGAAQCGYCTPGMLLVSKALLDKNPKPSREQIKDALSGNICRCTGYLKIFDAVELAAGRMQEYACCGKEAASCHDGR